MRQDMLGEWLPLALADILSALCSAKRAEALRAWGLEDMAEAVGESEKSAFLGSLKRYAELEPARGEKGFDGAAGREDGVRDAIKQDGGEKPVGAAPSGGTQQPHEGRGDGGGVSGA